jgi:hypothetical protein
MFKQVGGWVALKALKFAGACNRYVLKEGRANEVLLRKKGRFDEANNVRECCDELERSLDVLEAELASC